MSEELMDVLLAACFEKSEYHRKEKTDRPAVYHRKKGHCEPFGRFLWLLRLTGRDPSSCARPRRTTTRAAPVPLERHAGLHPQDDEEDAA